MFKKIIFIFIILIIILLSSRNHLLKLGLSRYLSSEFDGACEIERTALSLRNISLTNLRCSDTALDIGLGKAAIKLEFTRPFAPVASEMHLKDVSITLKNFERLAAKFMDISKRVSKDSSPSGSKSRFSLLLDLDAVSVESLDADKLDLKANFSFKGVLDAEGISAIKDMSISQCEVGGGVVKIKGLSLNKENENIYILNIPYLKIKEDIISDLTIPIVAAGNKITIQKTENSFFGQEGYVQGEVDLSRYQNICLDFELSDFSFSPAVRVVRPDEDIVLGGLFGGKIKLCFGAGVNDINANLYNNAGGTLNIKKEADLAFLKKYLDKSSYDAVIDNFKNYKYNEGKILINKTESSLETTLYFDSETMGKRDITINFHNVFGGGQ